MAKRVMAEDIKLINDIFYTTQSYTKTAEATGWSAATVRKYVISDYEPEPPKEEQQFDMSKFPELFDTSELEKVETLGQACVLSDKEIEDMKEFWKEMRIQNDR